MSFDYSRANKRWWALRGLALRRDGYTCREAARYGRRVEAQVVHHIWPAEDYPEFAYCLWNLISLSASAHDEMHDRKTRKLTAKGLAWKNRTPPPSESAGVGELAAGRGTSFTRSGKFFGGEISRQPSRYPTHAPAQDADV